MIMNIDKLLLWVALASLHNAIMIELSSNYARCLLAVIMLNFMLA